MILTRVEWGLGVELHMTFLGIYIMDVMPCETDSFRCADIEIVLGVLILRFAVSV